MKHFILLLRIVSAGILLQTLYFKFSGAEESIFIFSTLGVEPWGRWISGASELVASVLLLIPATQVLGALLALGIISGAILSHIFVLGIVVNNDGGLLFALALAVFSCCLIIVIHHRESLFKFIRNRGHSTAPQNLR